MIQLTLAGNEFERYRKPTRRESYLAGTVLVRYTVLGAVRRQRENGTGTARLRDEIAPKTDQISMNLHSFLSVGQTTFGCAAVP